MRIARVERPADLADVLRELDLAPPRSVLVVAGGAANMEEAEFLRLRPVVLAIAEAAAGAGAVVIDGGTDIGVMRLLGRARGRGLDFPLVGVVVDALAALPEREPAGEEAPLEPNHTHVLRVPGARWGDEVPWLDRTAAAIAGGAPSATVLLNGGDIACADAEASVAAGRRVVVAAGSGRAADGIAAALRGAPADVRGRGLAASGLVRAVDVRKDAGAALAGELAAILGGRREACSE